jgi:hypothetical protein
MSMIGNFRRTSDARVASLLEDPESIADYLYEEGEEEEEDAGGEAHADLDVDKAWHGIHFLLTGTAWEGKPPLDFIVGGGQEVGDVDVGYGPARVFWSTEVKAIADALRPLTPELLRQRFAPAAMKKLEIYPSIWDRPPEEDDTLGYLLEYYEALRAFIEGAAEEGEALIVFIN